MSTSPQNAPPGESTTLLVEEAVSLAGTFVQCTFYGVEILLYLLTAHCMLFRPAYGKRPWGHFVFITTLFILASLVIGGGVQGQILAFIWNRNYPGGPLEWGEKFFFVAPNAMGLGAALATIWLQDGFLLYRFFIIYGANIWLLVIPLLMYLTAVAFALVLLGSLAKHGHNFLDQSTVPFDLVFWCLSVALNVILTALIVGRLLYVRRSVKSALGDEHCRTYLSIAAMLVESAALYSVAGLVFLVTIPTSGNGANVLIGIVGDMAAIAPTLIAYRVTQGIAWTKETAALSSIAFSPSNGASRRTRTNPSDSTMTGGRNEDLEDQVYSMAGDANGVMVSKAINSSAELPELKV